jgi:DNA-binding CsgD family transcriptional regulator
MDKSCYTDFLLYPKELRSLNSINITQREVDIIACVINRRMADPSIAHQLGINKRTVETHLRNLTQKLRCTLQTLKNIVETSGKSHLFSDHYVQLLIFKQFRDVLDKLTTLKHIPLKRCTVFYTEGSLLQILTMMKPCILHFGIDLSIDSFDPNLISESLRLSNQYLILVNKDPSTVPEAHHSRCIDYISFPTHINLLMDIVEKLNEHKDVNDLIQQFNIKTKNTVLTQELSPPPWYLEFVQG